MDISKILAKLKTKYANLGFSDKALQGVANHLASTLGDEASDEDVDNAVGGVEDLLKTFNGDADRRATAAVEKAKKDAAKPKQQESGGDPDPKNEPVKKPDDMPEWAKGFAEQLKTVATGLANIQTEKTTGTRKQTLEAKLENAPEAFRNTTLKHFDKMKFDSDEEFEAFAAEVEEDAKAFDQELIDKGLGSQTPPARGKGGKDDKPASKEEVKDIVESIM